VRAFDVLGVTLPYELTYSNILALLALAGIPLRAADRGDDDPLVLAGGPAAPNPEPLADFLDAVVLGEGEEVILEIAEVVAETRGRPRSERLDRLARLPGVYVPSLYDVEYDGPRVAAVRPRAAASARVSHRIIQDFDAAPFPVRQIVPFLEVTHDRVVLEIMRGCRHGCRFCQAGMTYRPARCRRPETLLRQAEEALRATGYDEVALLAFTSPDYPGIEDLLDRLLEAHAAAGVSLSLPSLRVDSFSVELARKLSRVRRPGLTFAPEAGSERLRRAINKNVTEQDLFNAAEAAFAAGWTTLKLYFMIGLPTETEEDVDAIANLINRVLAMGDQQLGSRRGRLRLNVSVTAFVPKPQTPFQWAGQADPETLRQRLARLRDGLHSRKVRLAWSDIETSQLEAAFARGDRRLGAVLARAYADGARFDAWSEHFDFGRWQRAFAAEGLELSHYANRAIPYEEVLPWDHLDYGVSRDFLRQQSEAAHGAVRESEISNLKSEI
jgi:radical SAM family uncharacterized protein